MSRTAARWLPGLQTLRQYRRDWLLDDLVAGLVLAAVLVPVGMGYAQASGLPAIHGLYASVLPLLAYALFGPSRLMVLGPDSTLAAVIAAIVLPLSGGSAERALALAGALALLTAAFLVLIAFARLGMMADLFSKPVRLGFLNAIALTVLVGQLPKVVGFQVDSGNLADTAWRLLQGLLDGRAHGVALALGVGSIALILALKAWRPTWPGVLLAVVLGTALSAAFDLGRTAQIEVLGAVPQGLPVPGLPALGWAEMVPLLPGAFIVALLCFADTSVLSRALAARAGCRVDANQEMFALGMANLAAGLFQGFPVSASASRTPVAEAAGSRSQLTGVVGAAAIVLLLVLAPGLLRHLPGALLGAVVIVACLSFADVRGLWALRRQRPSEFALAVISFLGVAFVGVIEGIVIAIGLSLLMVLWNAWHPYFATLVRVDGRKGWHDAARHPEGRPVPGLVLFRWDARLFFANAEVFRRAVEDAVDGAPPPTRCVVVVADAITDIDVTAADTLAELQAELARDDVDLRFAGLKGPVRERLQRYGVAAMGAEHFAATVGSAVDAYRSRHGVDWKDWDER
jgi:high affinity sulfate transporter 1